MKDRETDPQEPTPQPNRTDYSFPPWWGDYLQMAEDDVYGITREQAEEIRCQWFAMQRDKWHLKLQYEAGVHGEWNEDRLDDGVPLDEVYDELHSDNDYRVK